MARTTRNRNGTAPLTLPPDVLGDDGRAQIVAEMLERLQRDEFRMRAVMIGNGQTEDDQCGLTDGDGNPVTYGERFKALKDSEKRLIEAHSEYMPQVEKLIEKIRAQQS